MSETSKNTQALLAYWANSDAPCPRCRYNLRALTQPRCPECGEELQLTVGATHPIFGTMLIVMTPGIFSGVAAAIFSLEKLIYQVRPNWMWLVYAFGFASGLLALLLYRHRSNLLRRSALQQRLFAAVVWAVHLAIFGLVAWYY